MKQTNNPPLHSHAVRARGGAGKRRCGARSVGIKRLLSSHRAQADPARQRHAVRRPQRAGACDIIVQQTTSERNVQHTTSNMENNSATYNKQHGKQQCNIQQATWKTTVQRARHSCDRFRCTAALWRPLPQQCAREGACRRHAAAGYISLSLPQVLGGLVLFALVAVRYLWLKLRRTL